MTDAFSMFGFDLDDRIAAAIRSGMSMERIYCELAARTREIADQIVRTHNEREAAKCCD